MASASDAAAALESKEVWGDAAGGADAVDTEIAGMSTDELRQRVSMLANQIRGYKSEINRLDADIKLVVPAGSAWVRVVRLRAPLLKGDACVPSEERGTSGRTTWDK